MSLWSNITVDDIFKYKNVSFLNLWVFALAVSIMYEIAVIGASHSITTELNGDALRNGDIT